jgi:PEP-CTERM motif
MRPLVPQRNSTMCSRLLMKLLVCLFIVGVADRASGAFIADSVTEFSSVQGQDGWFYGFYNQGAAGGLPHGYTSGGFTQFDTFNVARWEASDAQVGANNNDFLTVNAVGGHPNGLDLGQNSLIWGVRRYQSEVAGLVDIAIDLHKINVSEPRGGGVTGRIFIDGIEVWTQFIENLDGLGVQLVLTRNVSVGSLIDFAIDPTSNNPPVGQSPFSARADGSHFSAVISTHAVPEPSTLAMLGTGCLALVGWSFSIRRQNVRALRS